MTNLLRGWLLPPSRDPATRCAATVVDRFALRPPVDVRALSQNYCDIEEAAWPYECDAITVGLGHRRPQVFLRKNNTGRRRQRFSIGHELGHVIIPWHFGSIECVPDRPPPEMASGADQESEAHRFAGALLVPRSFLDQHAGHHVGAAVAALDETDISASAAVLSLSRNLLPGFCFLVEGNQEQPTLIKSSGTVTPASRSTQSQEAQFRAMAYDNGEAVVSDRRVLWFQMATPLSSRGPSSRYADKRDRRRATQQGRARGERGRGVVGT